MKLWGTLLEFPISPAQRWSPVGALIRSLLGLYVRAGIGWSCTDDREWLRCKDKVNRSNALTCHHQHDQKGRRSFLFVVACINQHFDVVCCQESRMVAMFFSLWENKIPSPPNIMQHLRGDLITASKSKVSSKFRCFHHLFLSQYLGFAHSRCHELKWLSLASVCQTQGSNTFTASLSHCDSLLSFQTPQTSSCQTIVTTGTSDVYIDVWFLFFFLFCI